MLATKSSGGVLRLDQSNYGREANAHRCRQLRTMVNINPDKWLVSIAEFVSDWIFSRKWSQIFLFSIPAFLLLLLASAVFAGGLLNKTKLRNKYLELGQAELERWQDQLAKPSRPAQEPSESAQKPAESTTQPAGEPSEAETQPETADDQQSQSEDSDKRLSPYAEMLFRRAHLLEPSNETQFVIGTTFWQRGAISSAQQTLEKIAPKDQKGYPPAHAVLAKISRDEFVRTRNPALLTQFQHHAKIAVEWPRVFPDVILEQANLLWQQKKIDETLLYLTQAAKNQADFYMLLVDRAKKAGQTVLAQASRKDGIDHFQAELAKDPKAENTRIQLAQLLVFEADGDEAAEAILMEGMNQKPSRLYARALSEIYRIRFTRKLESSKGQSVDLALLERALQLDATNPEIAQTVAMLMSNGIQASDQLGAELNRVLASGQATMATHAILSEYHLQSGRMQEAKTHLEQVYRMAPMSVKYANNLAYLYAKEGRLEDAEKIAVQTLSLLVQNGIKAELFVDELFDTLGMIYQSQNKTADAISSYESSLKLNPQRKETRSRLVVLYRKNGNEGVAKAHEDTILAIEKAKEQAVKNSSEQPAPPSTEPNADPKAETSQTEPPPPEKQTSPGEKTGQAK